MGYWSRLLFASGCCRWCCCCYSDCRSLIYYYCYCDTTTTTTNQILFVNYYGTVYIYVCVFLGSVRYCMVLFRMSSMLTLTSTSTIVPYVDTEEKTDCTENKYKK